MISFNGNPPIHDLLHVGWYMRETDAREVIASHGEEPVNTLMKSWADSKERWLFYWNGEPFCAAGVVRIDQEVGTPWMLATNGWNDVPKKLLWRVSKYLMTSWLKYFPILTNYVDVRNDVSVSWLTRLGATFDEAVPYGHQQMPFTRFEIR